MLAAKNNLDKIIKIYNFNSKKLGRNVKLLNFYGGNTKLLQITHKVWPKLIILEITKFGDLTKLYRWWWGTQRGYVQASP